MTLDEIIANMEHENTLIGYAVKGQCTHLCSKCQLIAFRAELEAMAERWDEEADKKYFKGARFAFQDTAAELRAKIGEGKRAK